MNDLESDLLIANAKIKQLEQQLTDYHHLSKLVNGKMAENQRLRRINENLQSQLAESQRRDRAAVEKAISWGVDLIEFNSDAHVTFCAECGFPIADYGVDKEISCTMCKAQNPSHNYVVTGPGSCRTTAERKAKIYDRLFGRGPQGAGEGETE